MIFARSHTNNLYVAVSYCGNPPEWVIANRMGWGERPADTAPELPQNWRIVQSDKAPDAARYG